MYAFLIPLNTLQHVYFNVYSHLYCIVFSFPTHPPAPHPCQHLTSSLIFVNQMAVKGQFIDILNWVFLTASDYHIAIMSLYAY